MSLPKERAWFQAKRYGYGWGLPSRWQGWVVMFGYLAVMVLAGLSLAEQHPGWFVIAALAATGGIIGICYWKGETPRWRWGDDDRP